VGVIVIVIIAAIIVTVKFYRDLKRVEANTTGPIIVLIFVLGVISGVKVVNAIPGMDSNSAGRIVIGWICEAGNWVARVFSSFFHEGD
jgi:hypothetical protein